VLALNKLYPDPCAGADFVPILRENPIPVIGIMDLDGSRAERHHGPLSPKSVADCADLAAFEAEHNLVTGSLTARPLPMTMTQAQYEASRALGFTQLPPKWFKKDGIYVPGNWCEDPFFDNCTGLHVTASLGGGIGYRTGDGTAYAIDQEYEQLLKYDHVSDATEAAKKVSPMDVLGDVHKGFTIEEQLGPMEWRAALIEFIFEHYPAGIDLMPDIEFVERYNKGTANSPPQIARGQFSGVGCKAHEVILGLRKKLTEQRFKKNRLALRMKFTSEDRVNVDNKDESSYTFYILSWYAQKKTMFNWLLKRMAKASGWKTKDLVVFYAGDTITDLLTALWGGLDAQVYALIVSNSRIAQAIREKWQYYGMQYIGDLWADPSKGRYEDRLRPVPGRTGVYEVVHKIRGKHRNFLVMGDERYHGTAPGSIVSFYEEFVPRTPVRGTPGLVLEV